MSATDDDDELDGESGMAQALVKLAKGAGERADKLLTELVASCARSGDPDVRGAYGAFMEANAAYHALFQRARGRQIELRLAVVEDKKLR